ncbi:MAG: hypothetical protein DMG07_24780 [Acidobacteria bacterium]|nr:MAG: hypothetical protein DMG07_24780 [Acidobacteriota bacterium]
MRFARLLRQPVSMDDSDLIREYLETGDSALFAQLAAKYQDRVFRLAVSILGPGFEPEAEEVAQEVFVLVYRHLSSFRLESRFGTWLYRIAYNRAIDTRRTARLRHPHVDDEALAQLPAVCEGSDPLAHVQNLEHRRAVRACVDELPDLYRAVLYLHYWNESKIPEIGELLGVPEGTVKSYMHRARQLLHALLKRRGVVHD